MPSQESHITKTPSNHDIYECANCDSQFTTNTPLDQNYCKSCGVITHDAHIVYKPNSTTLLTVYMID